MKRLRKTILTLCLAVSFIILQAQEATVASGGGASGNGGTVTYSVGQILNETISASDGTITQGVQQPYEFFSFGIREDQKMSFQCSVHPNPSTDIIEIEIENFKPCDMNYKLYDMEGKILIEDFITGKETSFSMKKLMPATYLLRISKDNQELTTIKIIKH